MIDERYAEVDSLSKGERLEVNRGRAFFPYYREHSSLSSEHASAFVRRLSTNRAFFGVLFQDEFVTKYELILNMTGNMACSAVEHHRMKNFAQFSVFRVKIPK